MITEALLTYVREQLANGSSRETVENNLRANGWTDPDIAQAFAPAPTLSQTEPKAQPVYSPITAPAGTVLVSPKPSSRSWRNLIIAGACILVGGGGAFAAYQYRDLLFPAPLQQSPQEILQNSFEAMGNISSVAFAATSTGSIEGTAIGKDVLPMSGTFTLETRGLIDRHAADSRGDVTLSMSFASSAVTTTGSGELSARGIYDGKDLYLVLNALKLDFHATDPKTNLMLGMISGLANGFAESIENKWIKADNATSTIPAEAWPAIRQDAEALMAYAQGGSYVRSLTDLGNETISETPTRHLALVATYEKKLADLLRKLTSDLRSTTTPEEAAETQRELDQWIGKEMALDLWIGAQDKYMYKIKAAPMTIDDIATGARSTLSFEISLGDHGKAFSIAPPSEAGSLRDVMQELFGGFATSSSANAAINVR
ncbi:hypothetical protein HYV30_02170 [Candidatus Kaiserbacteria bacterium]|nr:hypothetical protein [Candidatus Kaiserbacteria bacterium]